MSEFLAIDWDQHHLSGFDATAVRGKVEVRRLFALDWPDELSPSLFGASGTSGGAKTAGSAVEKTAQIRQQGEWLKQQLQQLGISTQQVLVCLPREMVVVRSLPVPDVSDHELPDIVRLQAETRMSSSLDQQLLDFLPLPKKADASTREVLVATVAVETVQTIQDILAAADLKPTSFGLSSVAASELVTRAAAVRQFDLRDANLVLAKHHRRLEISLVQEGCLLFAHSAQLHGDDDAHDVKLALAEISRSLVALEPVLDGKPLSRAWVIGTQERTDSLRTALKTRLGCDVFSLEALTDLSIPIVGDAGEEASQNENGNDANFAGPMGLLLSASGAVAPAIDFLNARQSVKRADRKTVQLRIAIGAVLAALFLGGISLWVYNRSLATELQQKETEEKRLAAKIRAGKPTLESAGLLGQWQRKSIHLPDQFRALNAALPGTDRIYMTEFRFSPSNRNKLAVIKATGFAKERADVEALKQQLVDMNYVVKPTAVKESRKDSKYPIRFDLDLELAERPKEAAGK